MFLTLFKSKSKYWQIVYTLNGKRSSKSTGTTNRLEAEKIFEVFRKSYSGQENQPIIEKSKKNYLLLSEFKDEYKNFMTDFASHSYVQRSIEPALREFCDYTGELPIKDLTIKQIESFLLFIFKRSKHTAHNYYRTLKSAFSKAVSWGYVEKNIFKDIKLPKIQVDAPLFIQHNLVIKIVNKIPDDIMKRISLFAFFTGMRAGEILALRWCDLNFKEKIITVGSENLTTKSRRTRIVPMSIPVVDILSGINRAKPVINDAIVFSKVSGEAYTVDYVSKTFKKAVIDSGLNSKIHFHTLRASFGSYLLQRGVPIQSISKLLGHQSIVVTEKYYVSLAVKNLVEATNHFNRIKALKK